MNFETKNRLNPFPSTIPARRTAGSPLYRGASKACRGFSLIEILMVISIMAILVSVGAPSFLSSYRASGLTDAGNQLDNVATLARENAISHNARTAVVLMTTDPYDSTLSGRAFSVWQMQSDQTWTQSSRWQFLPASSKAYDDPTATVTGFPAPLPTITIQGNPLPAADYSAFIFNPDGSMYTGPSTTTRIASVEYKGDPAPVGSVNTSLKNYYDLVFSSDTGAIHVVRR